MQFKTSRQTAAVGTLLLLSAVGISFAYPASAQTYPNGPVHVIVPYSAGGLADALARTTGAKVSEALGRRYRRRPARRQLDHRYGGCAKAKPDG